LNLSFFIHIFLYKCVPPPYEQIMSKIWTSHVSHINESRYVLYVFSYVYFSISMSPPHMNESCQKNMNESCVQSYLVYEWVQKAFRSGYSCKWVMSPMWMCVHKCVKIPVHVRTYLVRVYILIRIYSSCVRIRMYSLKKRVSTTPKDVDTYLYTHMVCVNKFIHVRSLSIYTHIWCV